MIWIGVGRILEVVPDLLIELIPEPVWVWFTDRLSLAVERATS